MALKAKIFKAELNVSDMDKHYYAAHALTLARHPSETDERLMARVAAFALYASEHLLFAKGLSSDEEPDIWQKNAAGEIELWIDLGLPSVERIRKACSRAQSVVIAVYGSEHAVKPWWQKLEKDLQRFKHLSVVRFDPDASKRLASLVSPGMQLQAMIEDGDLWLSDSQENIEIKSVLLKEIG